MLRLGAVGGGGGGELIPPPPPTPSTHTKVSDSKDGRGGESLVEYDTEYGTLIQTVINYQWRKLKDTFIAV